MEDLLYIHFQTFKFIEYFKAISLDIKFFEWHSLQLLENYVITENYVNNIYYICIYYLLYLLFLLFIINNLLLFLLYLFIFIIFIIFIYYTYSYNNIILFNYFDKINI